ncbi:hypothetical protein PC128_g20472 [Phytophthora cactorum]|nr:hypothetical protein PC128_g20472 [Phytophthora cactorum]KAG4041488.1 hypothetical protein PC123_g22993 [Phytophthora cactorum]
MDAGRAPASGSDESSRYADTPERHRLQWRRQAVQRRRDEKLVRALAWHARQERHGGKHRDPELHQPGVDVFRGPLERGDGRCVSIMSVGVLSAKVCELSRSEDRTCCYVHFLEGCLYCRVYDPPRPYESERNRFIAKHPLSETEQVWIGWYRRRLYEARLGAARCRCMSRLVCRHHVRYVLLERGPRLPTIDHQAQPPDKVLPVLRNTAVVCRARPPDVKGGMKV